jgi:hypothetical protein
VLVWVVTDWPVAPVPLTAGVAPALPPAGTTKTWNDGPDTGAGVHWNAHPMLHVPPPIVNGELVQFPWVSGVGPRRTCTAPVVVVDGGAVVGTVVAPLVPAGCVVALD